MARRRSPAITSRVMVLYRSSKICSGSNVFGKSTTFGNGKIGTIIVQRGYYSVSHPRSTPAEGRRQKAEGRKQNGFHELAPNQSAIEQLVCFRVIRVFPLVQSY